MKQNKPKFQVGDIVVVIMYGTVGTITKVHQIDKHYLYEVNHNEVYTLNHLFSFIKIMRVSLSTWRSLILNMNSLLGTLFM